jgi:ferrous iron transport protein A
MGDVTNVVSLAEMRAGLTGRIVRIDGGHGLYAKLEAMGIREGQDITKVSGHWMRGPVLLRRNNTQVALGFGMARRIIVQLSRKSDER